MERQRAVERQCAVERSHTHLTAGGLRSHLMYLVQLVVARLSQLVNVAHARTYSECCGVRGKGREVSIEGRGRASKGGEMAGRWRSHLRDEEEIAVPMLVDAVPVAPPEDVPSAALEREHGGDNVALLVDEVSGGDLGLPRPQLDELHRPRGGTRRVDARGRRALLADEVLPL